LLTKGVSSFPGPDSAVHMSEEIRDASRTLPLGMVWTLALNGATGLVMVITFAFSVDNVDLILEESQGLGGFPFIAVFLNATGSVKATTGMTTIIMILQFCATISNVATTSRQLYAFARDEGLPFTTFLSRVNSRFIVPLNALTISLVIVSLLSLINIGSPVAFQAIMSLGTASLLSSYIVSTSCVLLRRLRGQPLPPARWSLGQYSKYVEGFAILFLIIAWLFCFFPVTRVVTLELMNWSVVVFGGVVIFSLLFYVFYARKVYAGPVTRVKPMGQWP